MPNAQPGTAWGGWSEGWGSIRERIERSDRAQTGRWRRITIVGIHCRINLSDWRTQGAPAGVGRDKR
jgi:hypothetical protein